MDNRCDNYLSSELTEIHLGFCEYVYRYICSHLDERVIDDEGRELMRRRIVSPMVETMRYGLTALVVHIYTMYVCLKCVYK